MSTQLFMRRIRSQSCCCYDEPVRHCLYGGIKMSRRDEEFHQIWRDPSLPRGSWQPYINWGTTQGRLSLPTADVLSTIVKQSMLMDVDKLSSCSRFSDSVVGFTGEKTQPTASKYWRKSYRATRRHLQYGITVLPTTRQVNMPHLNPSQ